MVADNHSAPTPPVGVIESISGGFRLVEGAWYLLLFPLLLDLFLWLGPRVDFQPVIAELQAEINVDSDAANEEMLKDTIATALGGETVRYLPNLGAVSVTGANLQAAILSRTAATPLFEEQQAVQLVDPIVWARVGIPSLLTGREAHALPFGYTPPVIEVRTVGGLLGVSAATYAVGFVWGALFLSAVALRMPGTLPKVESTGRYLWVRGRRMTVFAGLMLVISLIIAAPFALGAAALTALNIVPGVASLALLASSLLIMWFLLFMVFGVHGILLNGRKPLGAMWDSLRVVQWHLPATLLLLALIFGLDLTLTQVWLIFDSGWMLLPGIIGHAVVSTALVGALFVYFKDRYRHWHEVHALLLAELERRRKQERNREGIV